MGILLLIVLGTVVMVGLLWWNETGKSGTVIYAVAGALGTLLTIFDKGCMKLKTIDFMDCLSSGGFIENKWLEVSLSVFIGALLFLLIKLWVRSAV